MTKTNGA